MVIPKEEMAMGKVGRSAASQAVGQPVTMLAGPAQVSDAHAPEVVEESRVLPNPCEFMIENIFGIDATEEVTRQDFAEFCNRKVRPSTSTADWTLAKPRGTLVGRVGYSARGWRAVLISLLVITEAGGRATSVGAQAGSGHGSGRTRRSAATRPTRSRRGLATGRSGGATRDDGTLGTFRIQVSTDRCTGAHTS